MGWKDAPEVAPTGKWSAAPEIEVPQYAPNGVPMNEAAKAEIMAKAKMGEGKPARSGQSGIDDAAERDILDRGALHAIAFGGAQGATFGFGDEIVAGLGSPFSDMTYDEALKVARDELSVARETRPKTTMGAEIATALAVPVGAMKSTGKLGVDMLRGAATGAGLSGIYGFGASEGGLENRSKDAAISAALGGVAGALIPALGAGFQKFRQGRADNAAIKAAAKGAPSTDELRASGNAAYKAIDDAGVQIKPQALDDARARIVDALRANTGFDELPGPGSLTPNSARTMEIMGQASARMADDPTAALPFRSLDQMRRQAGAAAGNVANKTDAKAGVEIIQGLDDMVARLGPGDVVAGDVAALQSALPKARETWARMTKSQKIDDAIEAGGDYLSGASSGIRNQLKNLLRNPKTARGFSDAEKTAMRKVINGSIPEQLLNLAGGGLGQMATALGGGAMGGWPGFLAGTAAAAGTRKLAEKITAGKAETLRALIANGGIQSLPQISSGTRSVIEKLMQRGTAAGLQQ
ncbi:MAG: hypothetical protein ACRC14_02690 [Paracoccaceae bacterium]